MRILHAITQKALPIYRAFITALICLLLMSAIWISMAFSLLYLPVPWGIIAALVILMLACVLMIWIADKRHPVLMIAKGSHQCH
jgi:protein-S-isoprenylcysteine O-methyltransferase Ste14